MSTADRYLACAIITGGLGLATSAAPLWHVTVVLLWLAVIDLTAQIRQARRKEPRP